MHTGFFRRRFAGLSLIARRLDAGVEEIENVLQSIKLRMLDKTEFVSCASTV